MLEYKHTELILRKEEIMRHNCLLGITLNQIKVFISVVEYKSFTKTAKMLNMTQATVSRSIQNLEEKTKLVLFSRQSKGVILTKAGVSLYESLCKVMDDIQYGYENALNVQNQNFGNLNVGDIGELHTRDVLIPAIISFEEKYTNATLNYQQESMVELLDGLNNRKYDLVFASLMQVNDFINAGMKWKLIKPFKLCIAVNEKNPLSNKSSLEIKDISDETIIIIPKEIMPSYYSCVEKICMESGFFWTIHML